MKAETVSVVRLNLELTPEEAEWLHNQMQNPLYGQSPVDETAKDKEMRERFFAVTDVPKHLKNQSEHKGDNLFSR